MEQIKRFTLDEWYITPFTARRVFDEDGIMTWVPLERNLHPTGQRQLDFIALSMAEGNADFDWMASRLGCLSSDLYGLMSALTGVDGRQFRLDWMFRLADDMLRYTKMTVNEVARHSGFRSSSFLCQKFRECRHTTPDDYRRTVQSPREAGRYRV